MLIYTVMKCNYDDTDIELVTINKEEALEKFKYCLKAFSYADFTLQVWENGKKLMDIWYSKEKGEYQKYNNQENELFKEIVKQLK
ncbi:hypothetical protein [Bacillus sp. FSL R10-2780]|uniref:hypothetical protein n=1 Tax=Bacillus sp. FSL R10-2780 TaxID=2954660 RepID=UPI0030FB34E1